MLRSPSAITQQEEADQITSFVNSVRFLPLIKSLWHTIMIEERQGEHLVFFISLCHKFETGNRLPRKAVDVPAEISRDT